MAEGHSILVVEDEPLIAMMLEDFLESLGHRVAGTVDSLQDGLTKVEEGGFDLAIIDVHLKGGEPVWPLADRLREKNIPFVIATGGHIDPPPGVHAGAPVLNKPYTIDSIEPAIAAAFASHP